MSELTILQWVPPSTVSRSTSAPSKKKKANSSTAPPVDPATMIFPSAPADVIPLPLPLLHPAEHDGQPLATASLPSNPSAADVPPSLESVLKTPSMLGETASAGQENREEEEEEEEDSDDDSDDDDSDADLWQDQFEDEPDVGVPSAIPGVSTWHQRNPDNAPIRLRTDRSKVTTEARATAALKRSANKEKKKAFQADVEAFIDLRTKHAEEMAVTHNVKVEHVLGRLMSLSCFKPARKTNAFNAMVHHLMKREREAGNDITWEDAKLRVRTESEFTGADKKQKAAFRAELDADNLKKMRSTRATNNAAATDARNTIKRIGEEMTLLSGRTGMPAELQSWGGLDFFQDILKIDPRDVGTKFELWAVAREKGMNGVDTLASMKKEITKYHETGVTTTAGRKKIAINWVQYRKVMILKHGIILKGWPLPGDPVNHNQIHDIASMTLLRNALRDGSCHWHRLSDKEKDRERKKYEKMVEDGLIEERARRTRSDKKPEAQAAAHTRSRQKGAKPRRVWNEDDTEEEDSDVEKRSRKRSKKGKENEPAKKKRSSRGGDDSDDDGVARKNRRDGKDGGRKRKRADDDDDEPRLKKSSSSKRKRADNDDDDERPKKKSSSSTSSKASHSTSSKSSRSSKTSHSSSSTSRFEAVQAKLRKLAAAKTSTVLSKVPPAMRRGPPGIRPGDEEYGRYISDDDD
ncbi:hypothetical protein DFH06DRAFT_1121805 [Mycena polygramma]|nr:hypothetical protein DFH06DRAFT_1121805 [Mycena polygramma]